MGAEGRKAIGYDHGYDGEVFYLGLTLDSAYVERFVEGCLERIGEDYPEGEDLLRGEWEKGGQGDGPPDPQGRVRGPHYDGDEREASEGEVLDSNLSKNSSASWRPDSYNSLLRLFDKSNSVVPTPLVSMSIVFSNLVFSM